MRRLWRALCAFMEFPLLHAELEMLRARRDDLVRDIEGLEQVRDELGRPRE